MIVASRVSFDPGYLHARCNVLMKDLLPKVELVKIAIKLFTPNASFVTRRVLELV